jgi:hypothetical protein
VIDAPGPSILTKRWLRVIIGTILCAVAWALLFARTMSRDLNHDEHQFLAPAALLSREGLQPWRDYPLFHLPNLVFAYAAADRLTGDLIFGAKLVCFGASALLVLGLIVASLRTRSLTAAIFLGIGVLLLLLSDPLFRYTAGKTWNHEVPTALLMGAVACLAAAAKRNQLGLTLAAGALGGLAAGCRLTFAPTLLGLFAFTWLIPVPRQRRACHAAVLTAAATAALLPSLYYLATQTESFIFGNFEFPRLRLLDATDTRAQETVAWWRKLRFFWKEIVRSSWPVFSLWALAAICPGWRWLRRRESGDVTAGVILVVMPFALFGCFAPSRYQYQHYFIFIPLLLYGALAGLRAQSGRLQFAGIAVCTLLGLLSLRGAPNDYPSLRVLTHKEEWFPVTAVDFGNRIRAELPVPGRVLTLAPTAVLSGRLPIYPELATGVFGWRGAHHVATERRKAMHLLGPEDLTWFLSAQEPTAILTGVEEDREEEPLIRWATEHSFRKVDLRKKRTLWLPSAKP